MAVPVVIPMHGDYEGKYSPVREALAQSTGVITIEVVDVDSKGFTDAVNRGIAKAREMFNKGAVIDGKCVVAPHIDPYIWILNQDAVPLPGCLEAMLELMASNPKCGIVASMQVDPKDEDKITYGGSGPVDPGLHWTGFVSEGNCLREKKMGWANGASMLVRMAVFDEIGVLDKRLKMICSDSDFCFRARIAGWEVWYEPKARVKHTLNFSANPPGDRIREIAQDRRCFLEKWQGGDWHELNLEVFD